MSSSTFEVRETENEDDKVLEFGLETCEENEISVSASIDEVPKDHTYTKEPDIDEVDIFENECVPDSQPEENNEVTESSETQEQKNIKSKKSKKPTSKSKVKKVQSPKKETSSKKGKLKKDIVSEDNNKNEDNGIEEKSDEKTNEKIDEHPRSRKKAQKRKVEEKENVLDTSIVEDIENITEESQLIEENSGQTKKKKTSDSSDESEKEKKVKKEISSVEDTEDTTNLPKGWVRKSVVRKSGKSKGQVDIYIYSPDGIKFRSKPDIAAYIARTKAPVKLEDFDFSRKRGSAIIEAQTKSQPKKKKPEPIKSKPTVEKKSSPKKVSPRKPAKLLVKLNVSSKSKKDKSGEKSDKQSKNKSSVKKGESSDSKSSKKKKSVS